MDFLQRSHPSCLVRQVLYLVSEMTTKACLPKGTWPKRKPTHGESLTIQTSQSEISEGFPGSLPTEPPCSSSFLIFQNYILPLIPKENRFPFSCSVQKNSVLEVKILNVLIGSHYLFSCCCVLLLLQFHSGPELFFPTSLITKNVSSDSSQP